MSNFLKPFFFLGKTVLLPTFRK